MLEISDLKHRITYELVSSEPAAPYAASVSKISLRPVTVTNATYIGTCYGPILAAAQLLCLAMGPLGV